MKGGVNWVIFGQPDREPTPRIQLKDSAILSCPRLATTPSTIDSWVPQLVRDRAELGHCGHPRTVRDFRSIYHGASGGFLRRTTAAVVELLVAVVVVVADFRFALNFKGGWKVCRADVGPPIKHEPAVLAFEALSLDLDEFIDRKEVLISVGDEFAMLYVVTA